MAVALLAGGIGLMAAGQIQQGRLASAEGKAQNKIAEANAALLESQAQSRKEVAAMEEQRVSRQQKLFMGRQKAEIGKSGLTMAGSNVDVVADTAYQFASDRLLTLRSGLIESEYMMGSADIQRTQGKWAKSFGKASAKNSYMQAGGTILSGAYFASKAASAGAGTATMSNSATRFGANSNFISGGYARNFVMP